MVTLHPTADPSGYLAGCDVVDLQHPQVVAAQRRVTAGATTQEAAARLVFEFVRDRVRHSVDAGDRAVTLRASEVLAHGTGLCYAKSHPDPAIVECLTSTHDRRLVRLPQALTG